MVENEELPKGTLQNILDQETLKCESGKLLAAPSIHPLSQHQILRSDYLN
ncbi:hypothetical protein LINPERHAP1_LOCUS27536 [Linum perenne]